MDQKPTKEVLFGITTQPDILTIYVQSNGCTEQKDFKIETTKSNPQQLTVWRVNPDMCKGMARVIAIEFKKAEVGLFNGEYVVQNNFRSDDSVPRDW
jgi:hypothetical protein